MNSSEYYNRLREYTIYLSNKRSLELRLRMNRGSSLEKKKAIVMDCIKKLAHLRPVEKPVPVIRGYEITDKNGDFFGFEPVQELELAKDIIRNMGKNPDHFRYKELYTTHNGRK